MASSDSPAKSMSSLSSQRPLGKVKSNQLTPQKLTLFSPSKGSKVGREQTSSMQSQKLLAAKLAAIKTKLANSKLFRVTDIETIFDQTDLPNLPESKHKRSTGSGSTDTASGANSEAGCLSDFTQDELLALCSKSKQSSMLFQQLIDEASPEATAQVGRDLARHLPALVVDPFANYSIQKIIEKDEEFRKVVAAYCSANFKELAVNEFSSRVMQTLTSLDTSFRAHCFAMVKADPHLLVSSVSAVFLVAFAIRASQSETEYEYLFELVENKREYLESKYFKRIVVSLVENAGLDSIGRVYKSLGVSGRLPELLGDKYFAYVFLMMVQRDFDAGVVELFRTLHHRPAALFSARYFGFVVTKLLEKRDDSLCRLLHQGLLAEHQRALQQLRNQSTSEALLFYHYLLLATLTSEIPCSPEVLDIMQNLN